MILEELKAIFDSMNFPYAAGAYIDRVPDRYAVALPLAYTFDLYANNLPKYETKYVRLSVFSRVNYVEPVNGIVLRLIKNKFFIVERRFIEFENESGYYHYNIDAGKIYYFNIE